MKCSILRTTRLSSLVPGLYKVKVRWAVTKSCFLEDMALGKSAGGNLMKQAVVMDMERVDSVDKDALRIISSQQAPTLIENGSVSNNFVSNLSLGARQPGGGVRQEDDDLMARDTGVTGTRGTKRPREDDILFVGKNPFTMEIDGPDDNDDNSGEPDDLYDGDGTGLFKMFPRE